MSARPPHTITNVAMHPSMYRTQVSIATKRADNLDSRPTLNLKTLEESGIDRVRNEAFLRGQKLARQERWDLLAVEFADADRTRRVSPAGVTMTSVLGSGARADATMHARAVISEGETGLPFGLESLDEVLEECSDHWAVALIVARAHMETGWAYQGQIDPLGRPAQPGRAFLERFERAAELLAAAETDAPSSPELAGAFCDLAAAGAGTSVTIDDLHMRAIALAPNNPGRLRIYGVHLLPRWYGSYDRLEAAANDMAQSHSVLSGDGAYAWTWFDALRLDPQAAEFLDCGRFIAGLNDILTRRPSPHLANLIVAYVDGMIPDNAPADLPDAATQARARIHATLPRLIDDHLTELHPQVWARVDIMPGAAQPAPLQRGRVAAATAQARQTVLTLFPDGPGQNARRR
ncbi:hypothetical protein ACRARG_16775 [Pseudooceanicola sp. C21-150M6]|uniref:hypothetical protein n=1 Tax=Pseudooceanicola sp. C21-150M6 TaxID=3434355 RepID=UPI003D7FF797